MHEHQGPKNPETSTAPLQRDDHEQTPGSDAPTTSRQIDWGVFVNDDNLSHRNETHQRVPAHADISEPCPRCGTVSEPAATICGNCGESLQGRQRTNRPPLRNQSSRSFRHRRPLLSAVLIGIAVSTAGSFVFGVGGLVGPVAAGYMFMKNTEGRKSGPRNIWRQGSIAGALVILPAGLAVLPAIPYLAILGLALAVTLFFVAAVAAIAVYAGLGVLGAWLSERQADQRVKIDHPSPVDARSSEAKSLIPRVAGTIVGAVVGAVVGACVGSFFVALGVAVNFRLGVFQLCFDDDGCQVSDPSRLVEWVGMGVLVFCSLLAIGCLVSGIILGGRLGKWLGKEFSPRWTDDELNF